MQYPPTEQNVRRYYDRNTSLFLGLSRRAKLKAIHQPLYTRAEMSLEHALHTQHDQILDLIPESARPYTILDLGCGVGESMIYLSQKTTASVQFIGVTISGAQATQAHMRIADAGLSDRITVVEGSFQSLPATIPPVDLAYGIESFIHSPDPSEFLKQVSSVLKSNGYLILFDDFLCRPAAHAHEQRILDDLKNGWLANSLLTIDDVKALTTQSAFQLVKEIDYSGSLKLGRIRDTWVHLLTPLARLFMHTSQYCRFLIGGDARQQAYQKSLLQYKMLVIQKHHSPLARTDAHGGFAIDR